MKVYNANGSLRSSFFAFEGFGGGVRVATGDLNGDDVDDVVVGAGVGSVGGHVKAFDGVTGQLIASFLAYTGFDGGVSVAVGDIDGDGDGDIVTGTSSRADHVKAFDRGTGQLLSSFLAYGGFTGGVNVGAGNYDGVGGDDIVTGTATGPAHVKVFNAAQNTLASFFAFDGIGGANVAAGDLDGNGRAELLVGSGLGAPATVAVFPGGTGSATAAARFVPFANFAGGVRVAVGDANNDGVLDLITGTGLGSSRVRAFNGQTQAPVADFVAFDAFTGGVFVG